MALSRQELEKLYTRYLNNQCTEEELRALIDELGESPDSLQHDFISQLFDKTWDNLDVKPGIYPMKAMDLPEDEAGNVVTMNPRKRTMGIWYTAAAVLLVMILAAVTFYSRYNASKDKTPAIVKQQDIAPGQNKPILTLANGSAIVLDNKANGVIAKQGNANVTKLTDGQLVYSSTSDPVATNAVLYNKVTIPRGGQQYQLTLPDGSKVWLNTTSSLRFPSSFTGPERRVQLTGEAYFEVTKDKQHPFIVEFAKSSVQVLGTEFNIMAYEDEPRMQTTLINGSVLLKHTGKQLTLKPGEAGVETNDDLQLTHPNIANVIAWKDGLLVLKNTDIPTLMRQIARWYDVDVVYKGAVPHKLIGGFLNRNVNLTGMLKGLAKYGVHCELSGKTIIVN